jgi:hypothetical protein
MSYRNEVTMQCPHCGHKGSPEVITYQPMAVLAKGRVSTWRNAGDEELTENGKVVCEECHEPFLYRLSCRVECLVAPLPEYFNPELGELNDEKWALKVALAEIDLSPGGTA